MADFSAGPTRNRLQMVIVMAVVLLVVLVVLIRAFKPSQTVESKVNLGASPELKNAPGSDESTKKYRELVEKQNQQKVQEAIVVGTSSVPTIVGNSSAKPLFANPQSDCGQNKGSFAGHPVFGPNGEPLGVVDSEGRVWDSNGRLIGYVGPDGVLRDATGKELGRVARKISPGTPVYDEQGRLVGTVDSDGKVRDANGNVIGEVGPDGIVRDKNGRILGTAGGPIPPATPVYDSQGRLIGMVGPDGLVRDANGQVVGRVDAGGVVRDLSGKVLGYAGQKVPADQVGRTVYDASGKAVGTLGADGLVRDANGQIVGRMGSDGNIYDLNGKPLGRLGNDVLVRDASGRVIGRVGPDGRMYDMNGKLMAPVSGAVEVASVIQPIGAAPKAVASVEGTPIYDAEGRLMGFIGPDGAIRDPSGRVLGKTQQTPKNLVGKPVLDAYGRSLGSVGDDGLARDFSGRVLGLMGNDGLVRDLLRQRPVGRVNLTPVGPGTSVAQAQQNLDQMRQLQQAQLDQQQADIEVRQLGQLMGNQATQLFTAWAVSPQQAMVQSADKGAAAAQGAGDNGTGTGNGTAGGGANGPVMVKGGSIMYAVLDTAVNTDEPGPILATIVSGPLKGARLMGQVATSGPEADKVLLNFNVLSMPQWERNLTVSAVAVDPNTSRTAFSSYTDRHILARYGTVFASSFMAGFGQAVSSSGATLQQNMTTGNTLLANPSLSTLDKMFVALGQVGQQMSTTFAKGIARPPTIHVKSGVGMGILFLADVTPPSAKG